MSLKEEIALVRQCSWAGWEQPRPQPHPIANILCEEFPDRANFSSPVLRKWNWCDPGAGVRVLSHRCGAGSPGAVTCPGTESRAGIHSEFFAVLRLEMWQLCPLKPRIMSRALLPWCHGNNWIYRILTVLYFILRQEASERAVFVLSCSTSLAQPEFSRAAELRTHLQHWGCSTGIWLVFILDMGQNNPRVLLFICKCCGSTAQLSLVKT